MVQKNNMNKDVFIKFNKDLYDQSVLKKTAKLYKDLANFEFGKVGCYITVTLKNIDDEVVDIIKDEYCNYVLSFMGKNN